ncbi:PP2C family protein-serine/threonine phosphatase [Streptomyces sp. AC555_RSS877]|uniref:PP2C family protein-serine/threonine phosphatase n=1 Tax=Streptomyces sp. AC555_RSS877 TaxID=2823688 RepID=UPI0020B80F33|nr:PP2C family protein-serine/threonine phosphatase [Streptomyces sp. AC555_RSS877]
MTGDGTARMLGGLLDAAHLAALEDLPDLLTEHASAAGLDDARLYVADLRQVMLRELTGRGLDAWEGGQEYPVDSSLPGRAFRSTRTLTGPASVSGRHVYWVPVLDGTERLAVLRVEAAVGSDAAIRHLASLMGHLLVSKRPFSDSYARLVRSSPMNIAAEMQWKLTPPLTHANRHVVIAAAMEPAYDIAGDAFDYAVAGDTVHLAIFDAMGHDTAAGLTANLAVASCRADRRQGTGLATISERIEQVMLREFGIQRYVTGILADLDAATGSLTWVNRGHHPPVLIRDGRWTTTLRCPPAHPMGTRLGLDVTLCTEQLQPGDRLLLYTDGITEARDLRGREFGLARFTDFIIRHHADGLPVPETLRRLMQAVLDHHHGHLSDDATVLFLEWHGPARNTQLAP